MSWRKETLAELEYTGTGDERGIVQLIIIMKEERLPFVLQ